MDRQASGEDLSPTTRTLPSPLPRAPTLGSGLRPWGRGWPCCPWGPPLQHAHLPSPSPGQHLHSCNQTASMFGVSMTGRPCQAECEPLAPAPLGPVSPAEAQPRLPSSGLRPPASVCMPCLPPASPSELREDQAPTRQMHGAQRCSAWAQTAGSVPHVKFPGWGAGAACVPRPGQPLPLPTPPHPTALVTVGASICHLQAGPHA